MIMCIDWFITSELYICRLDFLIYWDFYFMATLISISLILDALIALRVTSSAYVRRC